MSKRVLIADNDFYFVEFFSEFLDGRGYRVTKTYNGADAISKIDHEDFDVLIADLMMPGINGKQLIKFVRSKYDQTPFHVVALALPEQMEAFHELDADYCVAKEPVGRMTEHLEKLADILEKGPEAAGGERVFQSRDLIPRLSSDELVQMLSFQEAVIEGMGMGAVVVDHDFKILSFNSAACEILGRAYHELLGRQISSALPSEADEITRMLRDLLREKRRRVSQVFRVNSREIHLVASPLVINGKTSGGILSFSDV